MSDSSDQSDHGVGEDNSENLSEQGEDYLSEKGEDNYSDQEEKEPGEYLYGSEDDDDGEESVKNKELC